MIKDKEYKIQLENEYTDYVRYMTRNDLIKDIVSMKEFEAIRNDFLAAGEPFENLDDYLESIELLMDIIDMMLEADLIKEATCDLYSFCSGHNCEYFGKCAGSEPHSR